MALDAIHFDGGEAFERLQQEIQEALRSKVDEAEAWKTKLGQKKSELRIFCSHLV